MKEEAPEPKAPAEAEQKERIERFEYAYRSLPSEDHPLTNEDAVLIDQELGLLGICDGMGGYAGGREAAALAAATIKDGIAQWDDIADDEADDTVRPSLVNVIARANDKVVDLGHEKKLAITDSAEREKFNPPGTTAAVVKLHRFADGRCTAYVANVGDSRVYVWRSGPGELVQVTEDDDMLSTPDFVHKLKEEYQRDITAADIAEYRRLINSVSGEAEMPDALGKYLFRLRNVIVSSLGGGQGQRMVPRTRSVQLAPGDILLVTSDGVHDNLTEQRIAAIAATSATADVLTDRLTIEAYEYGRLAPAKYTNGQPRVRNKRDDISAAAAKAI